MINIQNSEFSCTRRTDKVQNANNSAGGKLNTDPKQAARLISKKFIARSNAKAIQRSNGDYNPVKDENGHLIKFGMDDLLAHQEGRLTYGHYLLNSDNQCKLFAFDIDLDETDEKHPEFDQFLMAPTEVDSDGCWRNFAPCNPREVWKNRSRVVERNFFKWQLRHVAQMLASQIHKQFEIETAVAYSGAKGVHVYGFTGLLPAADVREGALLLLKSTGCFDLHKGQSFFKHKKVAETDPNSGTVGNLSHTLSFQQLTIEVFPKQVSVAADGFGNLMRLPLGKNLKNPQDPTFFLDLRSNFGSQVFQMRDPVDALTATDQWA